MKVRRTFYNLQVWIARHLFPKDYAPISIFLDIGIGRSVEVALCWRTPYYDDLVAKIKDAQAYMNVTDEAVAPFSFRFVPDWFDVPYEEQEDKTVMGVVNTITMEIQVALKGPHDEDWEWTVCHELGHIFCSLYPEYAYDGGYDPLHRATAVWDRVNAYTFKQ